jgi:hypothetical protein
MKRSLIAVTCTLLAAAALSAQTPAKAKPTAGLGKQQAASNEDTNTRAYIELLRTDLRNSKTEIVGAVMQLDATEAAKFWPIYKEFEKEYMIVGDKIVAAVKAYADGFPDLTEALADQLANQVLSIEQERNALKKKYYDRMKAGVGAFTAARFLQVENQLERLIDLQIAAQLPVMEWH